MRYFVALRACLKDLQDFYQGLKPSPRGILEPFLPYPRHYLENGQRVELEYIRYLQDPNECQTFVAKAKGRDVVVKFVSR